jgi:hypothetical protein
VEYAEAKDAGHAGKNSGRSPQEPYTDLIAERYKPQLTVEDIEEILGIEKYDEEIAEKTRYFIQCSCRSPAAAAAVLPMAWATA